MKKIGQIIYQDSDGSTSPFPLVKTISKIAIQANPGTQFTINDIPITIGYSGYYELEDPSITITKVDFIEAPPDAQTLCYIDYIYEEDTEND